MRQRWTGAALCLVALAACSDPDVTGPVLGPPGRAILSDPVRSGALSVAGVESLGAGEFVYVSLPPGTLAEGSHVRITHSTSGEVVVIPLENGGFDPVPILASAGETLAVEVTLGGQPMATWFDKDPTISGAADLDMQAAQHTKSHRAPDNKEVAIALTGGSPTAAKLRAR